MSYIKPDTPYPVYAQPSMTGNAIIETQHNEKASLAMTTTSLLDLPLYFQTSVIT